MDERPGSAAPAIEARALTKRFGDVVALDGVAIQVPAGARFALLGAAGSGKSTLVRVLAGLVRPTSGAAFLFGEDIRRLAARTRARLGFVAQAPRFHDWMTGREVMAFAADLAGVPGPGIAARIDDLLGGAGLANVANDPVGRYAPALRQRLAVAQALAGPPAVLLLDEPFQGLDEEGRGALTRLLRAEAPDATVLVATRDTADVAMFDAGAILDAGRFVASGPAAALLRGRSVSYEIRAEPGQGATIEALLRRLGGVVWCRGTHLDGDHLRVEVSDIERASVELLAAISASGLRVQSVERTPTSLADLVIASDRRGART